MDRRHNRRNQSRANLGKAEEHWETDDERTDVLLNKKTTNRAKKHTLHQQRLQLPSEKVEMLQVSIGLQATHMSARELLYCRTSSSAPRLRMPSLIALGLSMNGGAAVATGKAEPTSTIAIATILE